jgi:hypothetical protein
VDVSQGWSWAEADGLARPAQAYMGPVSSQFCSSLHPVRTSWMPFPHLVSPSPCPFLAPPSIFHSHTSSIYLVLKPSAATGSAARARGRVRAAAAAVRAEGCTFTSVRSTPAIRGHCVNGSYRELKGVRVGMYLCLLASAKVTGQICSEDGRSGVRSRLSQLESTQIRGSRAVAIWPHMQAVPQLAPQGTEGAPPPRPAPAPPPS